MSICTIWAFVNYLKVQVVEVLPPASLAGFEELLIFLWVADSP